MSLSNPVQADFRFGLVRLREGAESVAFYNGEDRERMLLPPPDVERTLTVLYGT